MLARVSCERDAAGVVDPASHLNPSRYHVTRTWARTLLLVHLVLGIVSYACIWFITSSVCVSGPALIAVALVMASAGVASSRWLVAGLGFFSVSFIALLVAIVILLNLGPGAARFPLLVFGAGYLIVQAPMTAWAYIFMSPDFAKWCCQVCGYPLFGLTTRACPECGAAFDPEFVSKHTPEEALRGR